MDNFPGENDIREAVEGLSAAIDVSERAGAASFGIVMSTNEARTLLSYVRAVQSPRLTGEQVEAVRKADMLLDSDCLRAAFPGLFGGE